MKNEYNELFPTPHKWKPIPILKGYEASHLGVIRQTSTGKIINQFFRNRTKYLYKTISIKYKPVYVHRLVASAWLNSIQGKNYIDHINGNSLDNRPENLRYCTLQENKRFDNQRYKSPLAIGVFSHKAEYYYARICHNKKLYHIGSFPTIDEASKAYQNAVAEINEGRPITLYRRYNKRKNRTKE